MSEHEKDNAGLAGLVEKLIKSRRFAPALQAVEEAPEEAHRDPKLRALAGHALLGLERLPEAEGLFQDLVRSAPKFFPGYRGLVQVYHRQGMWSQCLEICETAQRLFPENPSVMNLQAQCLLRLGRDEEAEAVFSRLIKISPDSLGGYIGLTQVFLDSGRWEECLEVCVKAPEKVQDHPQLATRQARALFNLNRFDELKGFLYGFFLRQGVITSHCGVKKPVLDSRLVSPPLADMFWKACIGCGDHAAATMFKQEVSYTLQQGEALAVLYGNCSKAIPFFDNSILGVPYDSNR